MDIIMLLQELRFVQKAEIIHIDQVISMPFKKAASL